MDHIFLGEFRYPGLHAGAAGRCGLSIWRHGPKSYAVVIASELPTNPGTSITNVYDQLATHVVRYFWPHVPPWGTLWFEHYPSGLGLSEDTETYDHVTFALVKQMETGRIAYHHPSWRGVSRGWVAEAIGVAPETWLHPWEAAPDDPTQRAFDADLTADTLGVINGMLGSK